MKNSTLTPSEQLEAIFQDAKMDFSDCWDNPLRPTDRITRNWIYSADMENYTFAKVMLDSAAGHFSLYDVICTIMKSKSYNDLKNRLAE